jgi:hypothetical protein
MTLVVDVADDGATATATATGAGAAAARPTAGGKLAGQYWTDRLRPEPAGAAWQWALRARRATTALTAGTAKTRYDVFDYLATPYSARTHRRRSCRRPVLRAAADYTDGPAAMTIGTTAHNQRHFAAALHAWSSATRCSPDHSGPEYLNTLIFHNNLTAVRSLRSKPPERPQNIHVRIEVATSTLVKHPLLPRVARSCRKSLGGNDDWEPVLARRGLDMPFRDTASTCGSVVTTRCWRRCCGSSSPLPGWAGCIRGRGGRAVPLRLGYTVTTIFPAGWPWAR